VYCTTDDAAPACVLAASDTLASGIAALAESLLWMQPLRSERLCSGPAFFRRAHDDASNEPASWPSCPSLATRRTDRLLRALEAARGPKAISYAEVAPGAPSMTAMREVERAL